jgi:N-acetylneuraminic acid mutarotase
VLFTGGAYVGAAAEIYDASTGTFTNISNMRVSRKSHAATLLSDGRVFISGGYGGSNYLNSTEIYDPVTNTFSSRANMSSSRAFHSSILLNDGTVLIVGGYSSGYLNTAVIYNPSSNNYTATSNNMSDARGYPSLTLLNNGKVLIVGGANQRTGSLQPTYTAELYDPTTKTFSTLPSLPSWMYYHTATKQSDGLVLIAGGQATYGGVEIQTAILFDPTTNQFITGVTPMTTGRAWHSATLLPNGKTLFVGGYSGGSARTAEIYDPN